MRNNIGYHTRLVANHTVKTSGGSFGGSVDMETVNRLVKVHFDVVVKQSGRAVFVDKHGREVSLYLSVDPEKTTKGALAVSAYLKDRAKLRAIEQEQEERNSAELDELMNGLSHAEIVRRLRGE